MLAGAKLILVALLATPPPVFEVDQVLDDAWRSAADALGACSAKTAAAGRAGTLWVDFAFREFEWFRPHQAPTWTVRRSPGLAAADASCVRAVVTRRVLPGMSSITFGSRGQAITKELALGTTTGYLPPLASFLPLWREVARAPSEPTRRARLGRQLRPLAAVASDGCLTVHREERLQRAREDWLAASGRKVTTFLQPDIDRLGATQNVKEAMAFTVDGSVMLAGVRLDPRAGRRHGPPDWSLQLETYCLRPPSPSDGATRR
ncbi:MAG TPA: hypothetical protein VKZ18_12065 [Polyangia bacterium]|nr:hypothetical protein [Polyangia bacterium]